MPYLCQRVTMDYKQAPSNGFMSLSNTVTIAKLEIIYCKHDSLPEKLCQLHGTIKARIHGQFCK